MTSVGHAFKRFFTRMDPGKGFATLNGRDAGTVY